MADEAEAGAQDLHESEDGGENRQQIEEPLSSASWLWLEGHDIPGARIAAGRGANRTAAVARGGQWREGGAGVPPSSAFPLLLVG